MIASESAEAYFVYVSLPLYTCFPSHELTRCPFPVRSFSCKGFRGDVLQKALPPPESNNRWIEDEEE